jgi:hypothetical protein
MNPHPTTPRALFEVAFKHQPHLASAGSVGSLVRRVQTVSICRTRAPLPILAQSW